MIQDSPCNTANEKRLFHGTKAHLVDAICKQNLDWRVSGEHGTKYGKGSYFAVKASYSHHYTRNKSGDQLRYMFVCRVLVGSYTKGEPSYRRPPPKDPLTPASDLYDSCVDNKSNPGMFVLFDMDQYYPEYAIKYHTLEKLPASPVQNVNPARNSGRYNSNRMLSSSTLNVQRPATAPTKHQMTLANGRSSSGSLRSERSFSSLSLNAHRDSTSSLNRLPTLGNGRGSTRPRPSGRAWSGNLGFERSLSSSSLNAHWASTSSVNVPSTLANRRSSTWTLANGRNASGSLRFDRTLSSSPLNAHSGSTTSVNRPATVGILRGSTRTSKAPNFQTLDLSVGNTAALNQVDPSCFAGRPSSNKVLSSSSSNAQQPSKHRMGSHTASPVQNFNPARNSVRYNSKRMLSSSTLNVQRPKTAPTKHQMTLANGRSSSGHLRFDRSLSSSSLNADRDSTLANGRDWSGNFRFERSLSSVNEPSTLANRRSSTRTLANGRSSNGSLRFDRTLSSSPLNAHSGSTTSVNRPATVGILRGSTRTSKAPNFQTLDPSVGNTAALNQVDPSCFAGRPSSNKVLSSSSSNAQQPSKHKMGSHTASPVQNFNPARNSVRYNSKRMLSSSTLNVQRPKTAPTKNEMPLSNGGSLSGSLEYDRTLSPSSFNAYRASTYFVNSPTSFGNRKSSNRTSKSPNVQMLNASVAYTAAVDQLSSSCFAGRSCSSEVVFSSSSNAQQSGNITENHPANLTNPIHSMVHQLNATKYTCSSILNAQTANSSELGTNQDEPSRSQSSTEPNVLLIAKSQRSREANARHNTKRQDLCCCVIV